MIRSRGSNLSLGVSAYQRIISNNSYVHDEHRDNPGQEKRGFGGVLYKLQLADTLMSSIKVVCISLGQHTGPLHGLSAEVRK